MKKVAFPDETTLKAMRKIASKTRGVEMLGPDASHLDRMKFALCKRFVTYLREHDLSQAELAKKLKITKSRMSEIVNYRIKRLSLDNLVSLLDRLKIPPVLKLA